MDPAPYRVVCAALRTILAHRGLDACDTEHGRHLGGGLAELPIRKRGALLRVFFHCFGDRVVLLLAGYDKGRRPSARHQQIQIDIARRRLAEFRLRPVDIADWRSLP